MPHTGWTRAGHHLERVASILESADILFALGGSFAVHARGGYYNDHDVDFLIRGHRLGIAGAKGFGGVIKQACNVYQLLSGTRDSHLVPA